MTFYFCRMKSMFDLDFFVAHNSAHIRLSKIKSRRGLIAAIIFLSAIPVALLCQIIFGIEAELVIHLTFAVGFAFMALAVFDFQIPKWMNLTGGSVTASLAIIFLLQGVSQLIQNDSLTYIAFQILGQWLEAWLVKLLLLWFSALLLFDSSGRTRILGFIVMSIVLCTELFGYYLAFARSSLDAKAAVLKLLYLLPFVWLIFESKRKNSFQAGNDNS
jgi:hypothetical protein